MRHYQSSVKVVVFLTEVRIDSSVLPTVCIGDNQGASIPCKEETGESKACYKEWVGLWPNYYKEESFP